MVESYPSAGNDDNNTCGAAAPFHVGEHVDCLDTVKKWCNAEVREVDAANQKVFVHFTGFVAKYDEWISYANQNDDDASLKQQNEENQPLRILKQWRRGMKFKINNRIDVLDTMGKWLPAGVVLIEHDPNGQ